MKPILFGVVQGLTEFLPISSSGHLYLLQRLTGLSQDLLPFFVFLHLATLLAVLIFFREKIKAALRDKKLLVFIAVVTLATGSCALAVKLWGGNIFGCSCLVSLCFLVNALILFQAKSKKPALTIDQLTVKDGLVLGLVQAAAVLPGISRSGITITALLRRGLSAEDAFNLSFLAAIPIITLAFLVEAKELAQSGLPFYYLGLGFLSALAAGLVALQIVKRAVLAARFKNFGYYCLGIFLVSLFI